MNRYPMGADIADVMMTMGDDPMMVEAMFTDAEGQDLTYEWMSSDEMVATVMADDMDMSMASITAVGAGEATITVTATDSEGGMGMQTFMVTVEEANVAPMAGDAIADQMMTVGDDPDHGRHHVHRRQHGRHAELLGDVRHDGRSHRLR